MNDQWCILRMAGPRTLTVTASLVDAGFDVWTPTKAISKRRPRSNERREIIVPVLPSYAFARYRLTRRFRSSVIATASRLSPIALWIICARSSGATCLRRRPACSSRARASASQRAGLLA